MPLYSAQSKNCRISASSLVHYHQLCHVCSIQYTDANLDTQGKERESSRWNPQYPAFLSIFTCFCLFSNYTTQTLCNLVSFKFPTPVLYASLPTWVLIFHMSSGTYHAILSSMNMGSNITHHCTCGLKFRTSGKNINFSLFLV